MRLDELRFAGALLATTAVLSTACAALAAQAPRQMPPGMADPDTVNGAGRIMEPTKDDRKFDPRDFSGVWRASLYSYGRTVPEMTPEGKRRFEANKPSRGIDADNPLAKTATNVDIGRRRSIPPGLNNDDTRHCNPNGLMRNLIFSGAGARMEVDPMKAKIIQRFEWTWDNREIWLDGRKIPDVDAYLPRWNGYSVGHWEGDTLVVETTGFDERQWIDHFGYPISAGAKLEERWRRINHSTLEINMTLTDPAIYKTPYKSDPNRYVLIEGKPGDDPWDAALVEDKCVPLDEEAFNEKAVNPAAGLGVPAR